MKFNIDIKTLVFIISVACAMGGFYYTTQARLDDAEREIKFLWSSVGELQKENKRIRKQINILREGQHNK
jgi:tetrahydromethanopterin S-methyltransferase subunit G